MSEVLVERMNLCIININIHLEMDSIEVEYLIQQKNEEIYF